MSGIDPNEMMTGPMIARLVEHALKEGKGHGEEHPVQVFSDQMPYLRGRIHVVLLEERRAR